MVLFADVTVSHGHGAASDDQRTVLVASAASRRDSWSGPGQSVPAARRHRHSDSCNEAATLRGGRAAGRGRKSSAGAHWQGRHPANLQSVSGRHCSSSSSQRPDFFNEPGRRRAPARPGAGNSEQYSYRHWHRGDGDSECAQATSVIFTQSPRLTKMKSTRNHSVTVMSPGLGRRPGARARQLETSTELPVKSPAAGRAGPGATDCHGPSLPG
jgi:hypothetical protein